MHLVKSMNLEKLKWLIIWDGGSTVLCMIVSSCIWRRPVVSLEMIDTCYGLPRLTAYIHACSSLCFEKKSWDILCRSMTKPMFSAEIKLHVSWRRSGLPDEEGTVTRCMVAAAGQIVVVVLVSVWKSSEAVEEGEGETLIFCVSKT